MVFYVPFDDGTDPSLANLGTAGGSVTVSSPAPTTSTNVPDNLGSAYSERFTASTQRVFFPSGQDYFRLNSASPAQNMTVSLWMYIDATSYSWMDFFGTLAGASGGTDAGGWQFSIVGTGDSTGKLRLSTSSGNIFSTINVPLQQWTNIVVTWTTADVAGGRTAHINGVSALSGYGATAGVNGGGTNPLALHGAATAANYDDVAMWDTILTQGKIRSLSTAPGLLDGYNAGVMNNLFTLFDTTTGSYSVDNLDWSYDTGFDVTGRAIGDTWYDGDTYYMWLGGNAGNALGLSAVPEPSTTALLFGLGTVLILYRRRRSPARH